MRTNCVKIRLRRIAEPTNVPDTAVSRITFVKTGQDRTAFYFMTQSVHNSM